MIQLVHQFDRPGVLAAAAPQSCGGCSCCCCCCCAVSTLAASVITARSVGRLHVQRGAPPAGAVPAGAPGEPTARPVGGQGPPPADGPSYVGAKLFAFLLLPACLALGLSVTSRGELGAGIALALGAWAAGLAWLVRDRGLPLATAAAVFAVGIGAFIGEGFLWAVAILR
jgi:hypothetical protein